MIISKLHKRRRALKFLKYFIPFAFIATIFYLFVYPFLIASKILPVNSFAIGFGIFLYAQLMIITAEFVYETFVGLYNLKRRRLFPFPYPKKEIEVKPSGKKFVVLSAVLSYLFIVYVFAVAFLFIGNYSDKAFDKPDTSFIDALFLSFTSISVGPSGIQPTSILTKLLVLFEIIIGLVYVVLVFSLVTSFIKNENNTSNSS
jgi:hypothetical protein